MTSIANDKAIMKEVTINAPISLVWHAWTIPERVSEWFAPETEIEAKVGGAYELYFVPGNKTGMNTKGCKITKLTWENELQFTWKGPDQFDTLMNHETKLTTVNVSFTSINEDSTKVIIKHLGFQDNDDWGEAINWHEMAWSSVLNSLKSAIEIGEGNLCCQP